MIINVSRKYIFVHISKTAGNSIASQLKSYYPRRRFWLPRQEFGMHDSALEIRQKIGRKRFDLYYKFAFVRNPWDRLFSLYTFLCQKELHPERGEHWDQDALRKRGFKHWLLHDEWWPPYEKAGVGTPHQMRDQTSWLADDDGKILLDFVGKVEQLDEDFKVVCDEIGLPYKPLPRVNPSKHTLYKEVYDSPMIDFVAKYHRRDIDVFGYNF